MATTYFCQFCVFSSQDAVSDRDDAISSTTTEQTNNSVKLPLLSPASESDAFFNSDLSMPSVPADKIQEDVEDIVQDLENLLESGDSYMVGDSASNSNSGGAVLDKTVNTLEECLNGDPNSDININNEDRVSFVEAKNSNNKGNGNAGLLGSSESEALCTNVRDTENEANVKMLDNNCGDEVSQESVLGDVGSSEPTLAEEVHPPAFTETAPGEAGKCLHLI